MVKLYALLFAVCVLKLSADPAILPKPQVMVAGEGALTLPAEATYSCPAAFEDSFQLGLQRLLANGPVNITKATEHPLVEVRERGDLPGDEAYTLEVSPTKIQIAAKSPRGVYHATQTLLQLLPAAVVERPSSSAAGETRGGLLSIPVVKIEDSPRFPWRGLMLDSSRHFQTVAEVKRFIDLMSMYKLNVFHWHLTDGHGWRFESKKYPELTSKGAWRMQPGYPVPGKTGRYGGFYTQEEMKEVVRFAAARGITVVPEIEMPGHCFAFVASYPELGCPGKPQETDRFFTYPADAQRFPKVEGTDVLCLGKDRTLQVCKDILDETMEIFPSSYIHVGGDEVNKSHWKNCKVCQERIRAKQLHGEDGLQSWFMQELDHHLVQRGRRLVGWDEILEGGLAKNATVMSWQGEQGGIRAAKMGNDAVMSPSNRVYLDHGQSENPLEPAHWPGTNSLEQVYGYDPVPAALSPAEARHILGLQGNVWSVFIHEEWLLDLQTWPRAAAIAEIGWSPKERRTWDDFLGRLRAQRPRLDALGVNYWWEEAREFGHWTPASLKPGQEAVNLDFDITASALGPAPGKQTVTFTYTKGAHGLSLQSASLLENDREISSDKHDGFAGSKHTGNTYTLDFPAPRPAAKYVLRIRAFGDGGTDSFGTVHQSSVETKRLK